MMDLVQSSSTPIRAPNLDTGDSKGSGWSPEFIRGAASACLGVEEISFNPTSRVISFQTSQGVRINVYYTTRTIGTAMDHPVQGKTQLFRRNCSNAELVTIMNNPRVHTDKGYQRKRSRTPSSPQGTYEQGIEVDGEDEARNDLLECDEEMAKLSMKRQRLLSSVRSYDMKRGDEADRAEEKRKQRQEELDAAARLLEAENERKAELERKRVRDSTCQECYRVFANPQACAQHSRDVHSCECDYCGRYFKNHHALNQHRDAVGHWV
jgi:hypothetical protein